MSVHRNAEVHPDCHIGAGAVVWQFASVIRKARIGSHCRIAACAIVDGSSIGDRTIVSYGAFIDPGMQIGADVFVGPHVVFCNDPWPRASKDGWFDIQDLIDGRVIITKVGDGASIGAHAIVMPGVTIGERAMIAAGAKVTADVPADTLWQADGSMVGIDESRVKRRSACST